MNGISILIVIWLFYLALSDNWEAGNLVLGLAIAFGITALVRPRAQWAGWRNLPATIWAILRYMGIILYDMITSGFQVARILISPKMKIQPGIIAIPSGCQSELGTALSAHAITLAPGELVVEMDQDGTMYTHCLDVSRAAEYVIEAQDLRRDLLVKIFR